MDLITQILYYLFFIPEPLILPLFAWAYIAYLILIDVLEMLEWLINEFRN